MSGLPLTIRVFTLSVSCVDPDTIHQWTQLLDAEERRRFAALASARDRSAYVAAHALTRVALTACAADTVDPAAWLFARQGRGKPAAYLQDRPAALSFSLSHTDGFVGVALAAEGGVLLGFDLEARDRYVRADIGRRFFRPDEAAWIETLSEERRAEALLRLWTLKEAFVKATGAGFAERLSGFGFELTGSDIRFFAPGEESASAWHFEQRVLDSRFIASLGVRSGGRVVQSLWRALQPQTLLELAQR